MTVGLRGGGVSTRRCLAPPLLLAPWAWGRARDVDELPCEGPHQRAGRRRGLVNPRAAQQALQGHRLPRRSRALGVHLQTASATCCTSRCPAPPAARLFQPSSHRRDSEIAERCCGLSETSVVLVRIRSNDSARLFTHAPVSILERAEGCDRFAHRGVAAGVLPSLHLHPSVVGPYRRATRVECDPDRQRSARLQRGARDGFRALPAGPHGPCGPVRTDSRGACMH